MTQEEINTGCILLEEFLLKGGSEIYVQRHNQDWCSLMPVVAKVEKLGYRVIISERNCTIHSPFVNNTLKYYSHSVHSINSKIEAVFIACVEFVKWFNK